MFEHFGNFVQVLEAKNVKKEADSAYVGLVEATAANGGVPWTDDFTCMIARNFEEPGPALNTDTLQSRHKFDQGYVLFFCTSYVLVFYVQCRPAQFNPRRAWETLLW